MGMESFYINLELKNHKKYELDDIYILFEEIKDDKIELTLSYSLVSFFDALNQIYPMLKTYENDILYIESRREPLMLSLGSFTSFFEKMFEIWQDKIERFHNDFGRLLIKPNENFFKFFIKTKKHFKKSKTDIAPK